jgi:hypothetical protein
MPITARLMLHCPCFHIQIDFHAHHCTCDAAPWQHSMPKAAAEAWQLVCATEVVSDAVGSAACPALVSSPGLKAGVDKVNQHRSMTDGVVCSVCEVIGKQERTAWQARPQLACCTGQCWGLAAAAQASSNTKHSLQTTVA